MNTGLVDRVALVSGASQGIGRATALAFAAEGCHLAICARNAEALASLKSEIGEKFGVQVFWEAVDMRQTAAIDGFVQNAFKAMKRIDICVANSGGPPAKGLLETTDGDWSLAFDLSLRSAVTLTRGVIPIMQRQKWGRIVTISSITVRQPQPQLVLSNAIRTGVMGLVRSIANEFGRDGITANNVGPGYTATNRLLELSKRLAASTGKSEQEIQEGWIEEVPIGRLGQPEEIADAVVWFASERAAFITGQTLLVDGGMYKGL